MNSENENKDGDFCWGTRYQPTWKFVWNEFLLEPMQSQVHSRWLLFIVHGIKYIHFFLRKF